MSRLVGSPSTWVTMTVWGSATVVVVVAVVAAARRDDRGEGEAGGESAQMLGCGARV